MNVSLKQSLVWNLSCYIFTSISIFSFRVCDYQRFMYILLL